MSKNFVAHPLNNFVFFGNSNFSVIVLEEVKKLGFIPRLIVSSPKTKAGRNLKLKEPLVKEWADKNNIPVIQPSKLDRDVEKVIRQINPDANIVASYGKILPPNILDSSKFGTFNIHPSLLPKFRGPSPIQSQILSDTEKVGVSVIRMDNQIDHGPILGTNPLNDYRPGSMSFTTLGELLFRAGSRLLVEKLNDARDAQDQAIIQNDNEATATEKFNSQSGQIDLSSGREAWLKYQALGKSPGVFILATNKGKTSRVKIIEAVFENNQFIPTVVIPEARKLMSYKDYLRGLN